METWLYCEVKILTPNYIQWKPRPYKTLNLITFKWMILRPKWWLGQAPWLMTINDDMTMYENGDILDQGSSNDLDTYQLVTKFLFEDWLENIKN